MKELAIILVAAMVMVFSAGFGFADEINLNNTNTSSNVNDADANARAKARATGGESIVNFSNDGMYLGSLPQAQTHGINLPGNMTGDYGRSITNSPLSGSAMLFCGMSGVEFSTMIEVINKEANEEWGDVNKKIISLPFIRQKFAPLGTNDKVYLPSGEKALQVLKLATSRQLVGGWFYDSKFKKDNSVLKAHLQMRARIDAVKMGANVVVAFDEFDQRYFVPESFEFSVAGVVSWVARCFTSGASVAGSAGVAVGQNTAFVRPGAGFIFLRIEGASSDLDWLCYDFAKKQEKTVTVTKYSCDPYSIWAQIQQKEQDIINCWFWSRDNLEHRAVAAYLYAKMYICTGKRYRWLLEKAIEHAEYAQKNYDEVHHPTKPRAVSRKNWDEQQALSLLGLVYWNQAASIREFYGKDGRRREFLHADKKGLERMPSSIEEIVPIEVHH